MSKLESLSKFLILTEKCPPEVVAEVVEMLNRVGAEWNGCIPLYKNKKPLSSILNQISSISINIKGDKILLMHSKEVFYRENPAYCGGRFISAEYFLFLVEDHLYEQT